MKSIRAWGQPTRLRGGSAILALLIVAIAFPLMPQSSTAATVEKHRKVIYQVTPEYPDVAKRIRLRGTVRFAVQVGANGKVLSMHTLGGHPVLAKFAGDAVAQWRFEPSPQPTEELVEVTFQPN